jgi:diguanylate cyclase (GGDEF)-like protein
MGGDEFLCVLPDATGFENGQVRERLTSRLAALVEAAQEPYPVTATIGTAVAPPMTAAELDVLIRDADTALYARKQHGEASVVRRQAPDRTELSASIRRDGDVS